MSTIPKEKFMCDFPKKKCKKQCITCYVKYVYATDGREELEKEFKIKLASKQDEVNILLKESDTQIDEIYEWKEKAEALQSSLKEKEKECDQIKTLLELLTPGGSEFFNDPQRCVTFVKEQEKSATDFIRSKSKQIEELKAENERLKGIMLKAVRKYEAEMTNPFCMEWFKEAKKLIHNY